MSQEKQFITIEHKPRWLVMSAFAAAGAAVTIVALLLFRGSGKVEAEPLTNLSARPAIEEAAAAAIAAVQPAPAKPATNTDPNIIRASPAAQENMVPLAVADRYKERAAAAEKKIKALQSEIAQLKSNVRSLSDQVEAHHRAQLPPPPTQAEEVLRMLEPVLADRAH